MRFGFRALTVVSVSLLMAVACIGGENQCLNPQPDLPACNANGRPSNTGGSLSSGVGGSRNDNGNGQSSGSPAIVVGGSNNPGIDPDLPAPGAAGDSGLGGAGGDTASAPNAEAGAAGAGGAAGADEWR